MSQTITGTNPPLSLWPMGRRKLDLYKALKIKPTIAPLGDLGYDGDRDGSTADDLFPENLSAEVVYEWMGDDGFSMEDLRSAKFIEHFQACDDILDRFVDRNVFKPGSTVVMDFEKTRLPAFETTDEWIKKGLGGALAAIYAAMGFQVAARGYTFALSGLTLGATHNPGGYVHRVRNATKILSGLFHTPHQAIVTYAYHDEDETVAETVQRTAYLAWAHKKAAAESPDTPEVWFGISPFYKRSLTPVPLERLAEQVNILREVLGPDDRVLAWYNVTRPEYVEPSAETFPSLVSLLES